MLDEIVCAEDCDDGLLPVVAFDDCNPEINKSEIVAVFIALPTAADFTDVADPAEWAKRLSQNATPPAGTPATPVKDLIRRLTVIADKPVPTETLRTISNNRESITDRTRLINITIDENNDENYDLARATECGIGLPVKAWYLTAGGYLYGGKTGLQAGPGGKRPVLKLSEQLDRGIDSIAVYTGTLGWSNVKTEGRVLSPF